MVSPEETTTMWQFRGFASIAEIHQILKCCVKVYRNTFESQFHILGMGQDKTSSWRIPGHAAVGVRLTHKNTLQNRQTDFKL